MQATSWKESQEFENEHLASDHLCRVLGTTELGGTEAGTTMRRVVQVLILA